MTKIMLKAKERPIRELSPEESNKVLKAKLDKLTNTFGSKHPARVRTNTAKSGFVPWTER